MFGPCVSRFVCRCCRSLSVFGAAPLSARWELGRLLASYGLSGRCWGQVCLCLRSSVARAGYLFPPPLVWFDLCVGRFWEVSAPWLRVVDSLQGGRQFSRPPPSSRPGPAAPLEASQPVDIFGAALQEAHLSSSHVAQFFPMVVPLACGPNQDSISVPAGSVPAPPLSVLCTTPLRRRAADGSAQAQNSKRHASSRGRWYCPVPSCPAHCSHSNRGWSSSNAMKGHSRSTGSKGWDTVCVRSAIGSFPPASAGGCPSCSPASLLNHSSLAAL